jgi:arabinan endo-1,5-alpha-L-arabinosidase
MPLTRLLAGFLLTTLLAAALLPGEPRAAAAPLAAPQPVIARDFADADLLQVGSTYYAYSSNAGYDGRMLNIPVAHAADPTGPWTVDAIDALPKLPGWVSFDSSSGSYRVWAPDVSRRADGVYLMYYTARHTSGLQCIGAATSSTPTGPFTPVGVEPLICNSFDHGDIDPASLVVDGHRYLSYKDDANSAGQPASIWIHETAQNGINWIGDRHRLLTADPGGDERTVLDAPTIVQRDGRFILFYSADAWDANYHIKYAVSSQLTAPYAKQGTVLDNTTWPNLIRNPGGQDVVPTPTGDYLAFHALISGGRGLHLTRLGWRSGVPVLQDAAPLADGTYELTAQHSGLLLDVYDASTAAGAKVMTWTRNGGANQHWQVQAQPGGAYRITAGHSGLALSVAQGSTADGAQVVQATWAGLDSQLWYFDRDRAGTYRIISKATGKALDVYDASTTAGAQAIIWPQHDGTNQKWLPTRLS